MSPRQLNQQTDELIRTAFGGSARGSVSASERLATIAERLSAVTAEGLQGDAEDVASVLRTAGFLACMPSIYTVASSQPHTASVAAQVTDNLQNLSEHVLRTPAVRPIAVRARFDKEAQDKVVGQLTEIAVLGLLWWGIDHGRRSAATYALPATKKEDYGRRKHGYNIGTDIIVRESGVGRHERVQVKTSIPPEESAKTLQYYPGIAMVRLDHLLPPETPHHPVQLLAQLTSGKDRRLHHMFDIIDINFVQAAKRAALHEEFLQRERERPNHITLKADRKALQYASS